MTTCAVCLRHDTGSRSVYLCGACKRSFAKKFGDVYSTQDVMAWAADRARYFARRKRK